MNPTFWLWCSGFCVGFAACFALALAWGYLRRVPVDIKTVVVVASREGMEQLNRILAQEASRRRSDGPQNDKVIG